jgi:hypothetical protein
MKCPRCQHENRAAAKFCEECAAPLTGACANCGAQLSRTAKFCSECGHPAGQAAGPAQSQQRFAAPETYTPKHLAEKILTSKAALEGERKQVTVLFADLIRLGLDICGPAPFSFAPVDPGRKRKPPDRALAVQVALNVLHHRSGSLDGLP